MTEYLNGPELHRLGFWRARLSPIGRVLLERAHFEAVSTGPRASSRRRCAAPRRRCGWS